MILAVACRLKLVLVLPALCIGLLWSGSAAKKSYEDYMVLTVLPEDEAALATLYDIHQHSPLKVDFWKRPRQVGENVTMAVHRTDAESLELILNTAGMTPVVTVTNLQSLLDEEQEYLEYVGAAGRNGRTFSLDEYHRHAEINENLENITRSCSRCQIINIGQSYEGRDLKAIKISGSRFTRAARKSVWIDGGIHAREWISPATALNVIDKLVHLDSEDPDIVSIMDSYDWYILPSMNPDGYEYTWTHDRMWRKTRSRGHHTSCDGVDPNRNWGFHWMEGGASMNPCSETFAGPRAFSEPETKSVARFLRKRGGKFLVYLTLHAYGQYWLTPWGYTYSLPEDIDDLMSVAEAGLDAIRRDSGREYSLGSSSNLLYIAAGGSDDWAKGSAGIKYSYTVELRDTGTYGFILPANQIKRQGREFWSALKAVMQQIEVTEPSDE